MNERWFLTAALVLACTLALAAPSREKPTFDITQPDYRYPVTVNSLQEIDFNNFKLAYFYRGRPDPMFQLRAGKFARKYEIGGYDQVGLESVEFFDFRNHVFAHALVTFWWVTAGGSTSSSQVVQVFELSDGHPVVVQQIVFNARGLGASSRFELGTQKLTIRGVHGWEHCCPTTLDEGTFEWNGAVFKITTYHSIPMPRQ
jgi:hypothetical protein